MQKERKASLDRYASLGPLLLLLAALAALIVAGFSYRTISADYREKESLRTGLEERDRETQQLNEELTAANEEITAANEELTSINEEMLEAREELATANDSLEKRVSERTQALQESEEETQALTYISDVLESYNEIETPKWYPNENVLVEGNPYLGEFITFMIDQNAKCYLIKNEKSLTRY